jgi:DNA mismatch repair protein MutH
MRTLPPPRDEAELLARARALAGSTVGEIAAACDARVPPDLRRHKGWLGELVEAALGASSASLPEPDFPHLGIELKTVPVDARGRPRESTYVCTVPLEESTGATWEGSWVRRKLARVLWVPVEGDGEIPLAARHVGSAILWRPDGEEEARLRRDWEELMERVCIEGMEHVSAHAGEVLQIRPKAAHARIRRGAVGADGAAMRTNPRGFYLRASFTRAILARHFRT